MFFAEVVDQEITEKNSAEVVDEVRKLKNTGKKNIFFSAEVVAP
jgi:hypothetical protein